MYNGVGLPSIEEGCPEDLFFIVNTITDYFDITVFVSTQVAVENTEDTTHFICKHANMSQPYDFILARNGKGWNVQVFPKNIPTLIEKWYVQNGWDVKDVRSQLKGKFKLFEPKVSMRKKPWTQHTLEQFTKLVKSTDCKR